MFVKLAANSSKTSTLGIGQHDLSAYVIS